MSRLTQKRITAISLMTAAMLLYVFGGVLFRPHAALGAAGNGRIAFAGQDAQSNLQIYTMNADGSDVQQVTSDTSNHSLPVWSPDGAQIAYTGTDFSDQTEQIFVVDADGSHNVDITNDDNTQNSGVAWSPDGSKIAYGSDPSDFSTPATINIMNADGSNKITLTDGSNEANMPSWSPDGSKIAFICNDTNNVEQVCVVDADGSNQHQITSGTSVDYLDVQYSPSGSEFAYTTISHGGGYIQHLGTMNTDGSNQQTIPTGNTSVYSAGWSPDGTKLVYDNFDNTETIERVYTINTDGSNNTVVSPDNQYAYTPSWQPIPASDMDGDGTLNTAEAAAPNNGDANGDGIGDKYQSNVTSIVDPVTGKYVTVQSSCTSNTGISIQALPSNYADSAFSYPAGLVNFTTSCGTTGTNAAITQYFYGMTADSTMVVRKYNSRTHTYSTVPGATITGVTIGGQTATKITYHITDGGPLDQDGSANGTIVDPVGLAMPSVGTPNTGVGGTVSFPRRFAAPLL